MKGVRTYYRYLCICSVLHCELLLKTNKLSFHFSKNEHLSFVLIHLQFESQFPVKMCKKVKEPFLDFFVEHVLTFTTAGNLQQQHTSSMAPVQGSYIIYQHRLKLTVHWH